MVTGFHPFITFRDTDNARSFVQGVNGDLFFSTKSSIGGTTPMVLKNATGFVGIGTANPFSQLEIVGDGPFITLRDSARGNATCFIQDVGGDIILKPSSGDGQAVVLKTGSGNLGIGTGAPTEKLHVLGNARVVNDGGTGVALFVENTNNTTLLVENRTVFSAMVVNQSGTGNIMAGRNASTEVFRVTNAGDIQVRGVTLNSDQNVKANFSNVNTGQILEKLACMPIRMWNYKADPAGIHHVGPTSQDFKVAFELNGDDDEHISSIDAQGIALAAIQGLNEKLNAENAQLRTNLVSLETRLAALESNLRTAGINAGDKSNCPPPVVI